MQDSLLSDTDEKSLVVDYGSCFNCRTTDEELYTCAKCVEETGVESLRCQDCLNVAHKRSSHKDTLLDHVKVFEHSETEIKEATKRGQSLLYKTVKRYLAKTTQKYMEYSYGLGHPVAVVSATGIKSFLMAVSRFAGHSLDLALPVSVGVTGVMTLLELGCVWYQFGCGSLGLKEAIKMTGLCLVRNGGMLGLMIGGTKLGAIVGTSVLPGVGTFIGALIGAIVGGIVGAAWDLGTTWCYDKFCADNEVIIAALIYCSNNYVFFVSQVFVFFLRIIYSCIFLWLFGAMSCYVHLNNHETYIICNYTLNKTIYL